MSVTEIQDEFETINHNPLEPGNVVIHTGNGLSGRVVKFTAPDPAFDDLPSVMVNWIDGTTSTVLNSTLRRI